MHLTATFFETGPYADPTKSRNPTILGSGDPTSTQKLLLSGFRHLRPLFGAHTGETPVLIGHFRERSEFFPHAEFIVLGFGAL